jgi:hypothetical protein
MIAPGNEASHALFERHRFDLIPAEPGGYDIRLRPRALPL